MKKQLIALAASSLIAACAAAAHPPAPSQGAVVECEVRLTPTRNGLRIEALAQAERQAGGEYQLIVTKSGPNGASDIVQSGAFEFDASGEARLSVSEFNLERGDIYSASLEIYGAQGVACSDRRQS